MRIITIATAGAVILWAGIAAAQQAAPAGDIANGKKHFLSDGCWQCHGLAGQGAASTGPHISRTALPYEAFLHQLRQPSSEMIPYEPEILPDKVAADIYAYLQSMPAPPDPKTLTLLTTP
jgi:mono/diheme cytochrome c family protein